ETAMPATAPDATNERTVADRSQVRRRRLRSRGPIIVSSSLRNGRWRPDIKSYAISSACVNAETGPGSDAVAQLALAAVEADADQDRDPVEDLLVRLGRAVADQHDVDDRQEERSDHRPRVVARPAEHGAADDDGDDALEEVRIAGRQG